MMGTYPDNNKTSHKLHRATTLATPVADQRTEHR